MLTDKNRIQISTEEELNTLVNRFLNGPPLAVAFEFANDEYFYRFLTSVGINTKEFNNKYYYFNKDRRIHISESVNGYVWISTIGLVAKSRVTDNKFLNSLCSQKIVLLHLIDDAISLSNNENSYDIDSHHYSLIEQLTPALFHNTIFYLELLSKAYLSINGENVPQIHKLETLLSIVMKTLFQSHQNDSLFHVHAIPPIEEMVKHISSINGDFKESFVKYDDNSDDSTIVDFNTEHLLTTRDIVELTCEMIEDLYYEHSNSFYFSTGLYERLKKNCDTPEKLERLERDYGFLKSTK